LKGDQGEIGTLTSGYSAITATLTANAVAVVQFDVVDWHPEARRQWMNDVHRSWNTEALNTATRGAKMGGIAKGLIVAEAVKITIYDLTDPSVPMWFSKTGGSSSHMFTNTSSITMVNGVLIVGDATVGVYEWNFLTGKVSYRSTAGRYLHSIDLKSGLQVDALNLVDSSAKLVDNAVNSVAITTLKNAPLVNGVPVPTILASTPSGISQIGWDGIAVDNVWDLTHSNAIEYVDGVFTSDGKIAYLAGGGGDGVRNIHVNELLTADVSLGVYAAKGSGAEFYGGHIASTADMILSSILNYIDSSLRTDGANLRIGTGQGFITVLRNPSDPAHGLYSNVSATYNTGWMHGNTVRCFLANSKSADRSVKAATLVETGTVTETVNAGGRNVYSGFSAANYFSEASHADWNAIGTGDFSIVLEETSINAISAYCIASAGDGVSVGSWKLWHHSANAMRFLVHNGTSFVVAGGDAYGFPTGIPCVYEVSRKAGVITHRANGVDLISGSTNAGLTLSNTTGQLRIGDSQDVSEPFTGSLATVKISVGSAPTAEQSLKIAQDSNKLNNGALCLLTADAVTDSEYLKSSGIYEVETAGAYDYLKGLEVLHRGIAKDDTTDLGLDRVQVNGTTDVRVSMKAVPLREQLVLNSANDSTPPKIVYANGTAYSAPIGSTIVAAIDMITGLPFDFDLTPVSNNGFIYSVTLATANKHMITLEAVQ